jgi:hypothetical protein
MKRTILFIAIMFSLAVHVTAQTSLSSDNPYSYTKTGDTLVNADTVMLQLVRYDNGLASIQPIVTKVSGTVAGYALLQATNDGSTWTNVNTDTMKLADQPVNCSKLWKDVSSYRDIRVLFITTGTSVCVPSIAYTRRQQFIIYNY